MLTKPSIHFLRLSIIATLLAFVVISLGAYVRLSNAGLSCPDWPFCYGHVGVPMSEHAIAKAEAAYPERPVTVEKAWKEMIHRYLASTLGLLILALAVWAWQRRQVAQQPVILPMLLVALVIFQGLLGMWTVTLLLKPAVVTAHLLGGLATLGLLAWLSLRYSAAWWRPPAPNVTQTVRVWGVLALLVLSGQIFLGGWTSTHYAALACGNHFPTCQGEWLPPMQFEHAFDLWQTVGINYEGGVLDLAARTAIHWSHRLGALLTTLVVGGLALWLILRATAPALRYLAALVLGLLLLQISLGIANVWFLLPLPLAVAHNSGAALLLLSLISLNHVLNLPEEAPTDDNANTTA